MNPHRLTAFTLAYAPAIVEAHQVLGAYGYRESPAEYALRVTLSFVAALERAGVEGIAGYALNRQGGALKLACAALGFEYTVRALQDYLDGK